MAVIYDDNGTPRKSIDILDDTIDGKTITKGTITRDQLAPDIAQQIGIVGEVRMWLTNTAPNEWLICDGSSIDKGVYSALFDVIGYTYGGAGNVFNLPNMKGKVMVGRDAGQVEFANLGTSGGSKTHTLSINEIPSHNHNLTDPGHNHGYHRGVAVGNTGIQGGIDIGYYDDFTDTATTGITIQSEGGGLAHNNLQPYLTVQWIIKY